jgi:Arc/MetJ-type ribon-helix-helix transcriptional regulator
MNISLPDPLGGFVDRQIAEGRYSSREAMAQLKRRKKKG